MSVENSDFSIKACEQDLILKTGEALLEKYSRNYQNNKQFRVIENALDRYGREIREVLRNGYAPEFSLARWIYTYVAADLEEPIYQTGQNAYSFLGYLYWLTDGINPLDHDYAPEVLFGENFEKPPLFSFIVPFGVRSDIVHQLEDLFPEGVSEPDENTIRVVWAAVRDQNEKKEADRQSGAEATVTVKVAGENAGETADEGKMERTVDIMILERHLLSFAKNLNAAGTPDYLYPIRCDEKIQETCEQAFDVKPFVFKPEQKLPDFRMDRIRAVLSDVMDLMVGEPSQTIDSDLLADKEMFLDECVDGTFGGLVKAIAVMRGRGVWKYHRLICSLDENDRDSIPVDDMVCTRDDIHSLCARTLDDTENRFRVAERISKGQGRSPLVQSILQEENVPEWMRLMADTVQYAVSEAGCFAYVKTVLFLAFEREVNPELYEKFLDGRMHAAAIRADIETIRETYQRAGRLRDEEKYEEAYQLDFELHCRIGTLREETGYRFWHDINAAYLQDLYLTKRYMDAACWGDAVLEWRKLEALDEEEEHFSLMYMMMMSWFYEKAYEKAGRIGRELIAFGGRVLGEDHQIMKKTHHQLSLIQTLLEAEEESEEI